MIPALIKVRQELVCPRLKDPISELKKQLLPFSRKIKPGDRVAIAVGSRGIARIDELVKVIVEWVKARGEPMIIPAMGSHGASTSIGQKQVLAELGISEAKMGCKIFSEIKAKKIGEIAGINVWTDKFILKADHLILINRIKPHTSFHGKYESGLCKMLALGLGKREGASELHKFGPAKLAELIPVVAEYLLQKLPVLLGVAVLENYKEEIAQLEILSGEEFLEKEPKLLKKARELVPGLPFSELEVLVIDQIGKDKSGTGMDTNVIGRLGLFGIPEPKEPKIHRIVVLDLSAKTKGGAYGIGLADITTKRVIDKLDYESMKANALASTFMERARIPLWFESDKEAIISAIKTSWIADLSRIRMVRIKSSLELEEFWITENLLKESKVSLRIISKKVRLKFDKTGNLLDLR